MEKKRFLTKNRFGITIVKCCASCRHKKCDNRMRLCMRGKGNVSPDYLCDKWEMAEQLEIVGKGDGKVKQKEYLEFCSEEIEKLVDVNNSENGEQ